MYHETLYFIFETWIIILLNSHRLNYNIFCMIAYYFEWVRAIKKCFNMYSYYGNGVLLIY